MKKYFNLQTILLFCIVLIGSVGIAFVPTTNFVLWYGTITVTYFALHVLQTLSVEIYLNNKIHLLQEHMIRQLEVMSEQTEHVRQLQKSYERLSWDLDKVKTVVNNIEFQTKPKSPTSRKKKETPKSWVTRNYPDDKSSVQNS